MPSIVIEIDEQGNVSTDYLGFQGKGCDFAEQELIRLLKDMELGKKSEKRKDHIIGEKLRV